MLLHGAHPVWFCRASNRTRRAAWVARLSPADHGRSAHLVRSLESPGCRSARQMRVFRADRVSSVCVRCGWPTRIRSARAQLKKELASGKIELAQILAQPPECVRTARVRDVLLALPKIGSVKGRPDPRRLRHRSREDARRPDRSPTRRTAEPLPPRRPRQVIATANQVISSPGGAGGRHRSGMKNGAAAREPLGRSLLRGGGEVRVDLGKYGIATAILARAGASRFDFHLRRR